MRLLLSLGCAGWLIGAAIAASWANALAETTEYDTSRAYSVITRTLAA